MKLLRYCCRIYTLAEGICQRLSLIRCRGFNDILVYYQEAAPTLETYKPSHLKADLYQRTNSVG